MNVYDAIQSRRSIKRFTDRPVSAAEIERLLEVAALAPNHRMTQPWRFIVFGPAARRAYGEVLGGRKARKVEDPDAAAAVREKVASEQAALPAMLGVVIRQDENPEIRQEDYAAAMMGVENLAVAAVEMGLGTHLKTGAVMDDPAARAVAGLSEGERLVAVINLGEPAEIPAEKPRETAAGRTTWLD